MDCGKNFELADLVDQLDERAEAMLGGMFCNRL
jgi:hypothetical protein